MIVSCKISLRFLFWLGGCFVGFFFSGFFTSFLLAPVFVACLYLPCTVLFEVLSCFLVTGARMLHVNPRRAKRWGFFSLFKKKRKRKRKWQSLFSAAVVVLFDSFFGSFWLFFLVLFDFNGQGFIKSQITAPSFTSSRNNTFQRFDSSPPVDFFNYCCWVFTQLWTSPFCPAQEGHELPKRLLSPASL